jgi:hypothetical protein
MWDRQRHIRDVTVSLTFRVSYENWSILVCCLHDALQLEIGSLFVVRLSHSRRRDSVTCLHKESWSVFPLLSRLQELR